MFIEQVSVVVRAIAQSFIQSDWVPQSDRHPVRLGTQSDRHPVGLGTQSDWIPSPTGTQLTSHDWNWCIPTFPACCDQVSPVYQQFLRVRLYGSFTAYLCRVLVFSLCTFEMGL
jgi:hypothetical protein